MTKTRSAPVVSHTTVPSGDGMRIGLHTLGAGDGLIIVGGAMRTALDYLPLAAALARRFEVHVMDRRGRGASGPQGTHYSIQQECQDLLAVQEHVGADAVFGHSFGGLVALEAAKLSTGFSRVAVYEPAMSLQGSLPTTWMPRYRQLLADGDTRGAFAHFLQRCGHAPAIVEKLPQWYLKTVLRVVVRKPRWERLEPLLLTNLREHELVLQAHDSLSSYSAISAPVLLLGGADSPAFSTRPMHELHDTLRDSTVELLADLDHNAPDEKDPGPVAERLLRFLDHS